MPEPAPSRTSVATALLAIVALACAACSRPVRCVTDGPSPNVVLVTIDTLRADHVSASGAGRAETPNLDRLAADGALFENAYADVSWTTASVSSTMTGTYATKHGIRNFNDRLGADTVTIAEVLRAAGYRTGAVVGSYPVDSIYGLDQGFEFYDDAFTRSIALAKADSFEKIEARWHDDPAAQARFNANKLHADSRRTDEEVTDAALTALERVAGDDAPFFLWLHYFGPHSIPDPAASPADNNRRHVETYAAKVAGADREVGRFMDALRERGLAASTLVVIHSDHGESLGEHKFVGHGRFLFEDNLRVPMILHWPDRIAAGTRIAAMSANVDLFATIADACGCLDVVQPTRGLASWLAGERPAGDIPTPTHELDGHSLLRVIDGDARPRRATYAETWMPTGKLFASRHRDADGTMHVVPVARFAMVRPPFKLVRTRPAQLVGPDGTAAVPDEVRERFVRDDLFDLAADPRETWPQPPHVHVPVRARLARDLDPYFEPSRERLEGGAHEPLRDTDEEKLRALGYVE